MRIVTALLLLIHGAIHVPGFLKAWRLAELPALTGKTLVSLSDGATRTVGVLWLAAAVAFVAAAVLRVFDRDAWWMVAGATLVLSQALIILQWSDAKAGTVANVMLLVLVVIAAGVYRFHAANVEHKRALLAPAPTTPPSIVRAEEFAALPAPVRRWLAASGIVGKPRTVTARLVQRGELRTGPTARFMPATATQVFRIDEPGFVWTVDLSMFGLPVTGRDAYVHDRGRMYITLAGLIPVADGTGPHFDSGTALRFLGEIIWFPSAALEPYIAWSPMDDTHAKATLTHGDVQVSAVFAFDKQGRFTSLTAQRSYNGGALETWVIPATEWKSIHGIQVPVQGNALWKLRAGDFDYYRWQLTDLEANPRSL